MNSMFKLAAASILVLGIQGLAVAKPIDPTANRVEAFVPANPNAPAPAVQLTSGFEPGEGFAPGYIGGQAGWTTFAASSAQPVINATSPIAGAQDLQIAGDGTISAGTNTGAFSPDLGPQNVTDPSSLSVDIRITATGGADYDVVPQAPSQSFLSARVKFGFLGTIQILDDTGGGLAFVDTGINWPVNTTFNLRIELDPVANTLDYYINNALIYSSVAGVFAGTQMEQVVLISDNFQAGEVGEFDNVVLDTNAGAGVPFTPPAELPFLGNLGLLLAGLLLAGAGLMAIRR
ncbi:MAG: hypothetical protein R3F08_15440 [Dokdonella sp.]|nr:hypothetical protein [Dokdonella sp.]MCB1569599.1 hypothetical protein [Xanthomonadales bacterium]MCB1572675.1 hypothetical protein [Xanthomonadales bacterium]